MNQQNPQGVAPAATDQKTRLPVSEASAARLDEPPSLLSMSRIGAPGSVGALCVDLDVNPAFIMESLIRDVMTGTEFYGVKTEKVGKIAALASNELMQTMLLATFGAPDVQKTLKVVAPTLAGGANWLLPEGRLLLEKSVGNNCDLAAVAVPARPRKMPLSFDQLPALITSLRQKSRAGIVVFHGLAADEVKQLLNYFCLLLTVQACEPDQGFASAYMVAPAAGTFLAGVNVSPCVDNIRQMANGQIERKSYPSHARDPETREMVKLREQGITLAAIAKEFDVEPSTVLRRLRALPYGHRHDRGA